MRNYPNGSKWKSTYHVPNSEVTVEAVIYNDATGEKCSDQDLIVYRDHGSDDLISVMRRKHADEYLEKVEPKWEVGVTYEPPGSTHSGRNNIVVRFVFDDGSAAYETKGYARNKGVNPPEYRKHWAVKADE